MARIVAVAMVVGVALGLCYVGVMKQSSPDAATWRWPDYSGAHGTLPPGFTVAFMGLLAGWAVAWWTRRRAGAPWFVAAIASASSGIIAVGLSIALVVTWLGGFPAAGWTILGLGSLFLLVGASLGLGPSHRY